MNLKNFGSKWILAPVIALSAFAGAAAVTAFNAAQVSAQTTTVTQAPAISVPSPSNSVINPGSSGTFKSNEVPTHEAKESAARESQENAGQRPTVQ